MGFSDGVGSVKTRFHFITHPIYSELSESWQRRHSVARLLVRNVISGFYLTCKCI